MASDDRPDEPLSDRVDHSQYVREAEEMVAMQLDCDLIEAAGRLKLRAAAAGKTLEDLSMDVLDGVIRFS
jgi:hypothetical protein